MSEKMHAPAAQASAEAEDTGNSPLFNIVAGLLPVIFAAILFLPILRFGFVNVDDQTNIFGNPHIYPIAKQNLGHFWTHGYYELYTPVTYMLWGGLARFAPLPVGIEVPGSGTAYLDPAVYHTASLVLHLLNTGLAYILLRQIRFRAGAAAIGALLFAVHPVQVESVAWVTGMNNLTGGFFSLLALIGYMAWGQSEGQPALRRNILAASATFVFLLALLSKPTSAAAPFLALALEWVVLHRPRARWLPLIGFWLILTGVILIITRITASYGNSFVPSPLWGRPFVIGDELAWYLAHLVYPRADCVNYGRTIPIVLGHWWGYVSWIIPSAVGLLLWRIKERDCGPRLAVLILLAALLPTLGVVPFYTQRFSTVADRFLYLAMLGPAILAAWALTRFRFRPVVAVPILLLTLAFAFRTSFLLPVWRDTYSAAANSILVNPNDTVGHTNYGIALALKGRLGDALEHFRIAVGQQPENPEVQYHLGVTLADLGDLKGAITPLREATRLQPNLDEAWFRLGIALAKSGNPADISEAEAAFRERLKHKPGDGQAHYILGILLANSHQDADALPELTAAAEIQPQFAEGHISLAKVLERLGHTDAAKDEYQKVLQINPQNAAAKVGLAKLGAGK